MTPYSSNFARILALTGGAVSDQILNELSSNIGILFVKAVVANWPYYVKRVQFVKEHFTLYQGKIIIPYGFNKAALLPLTPDQAVEIVDFDFGGTPPPVEVAQEAPLARKAASLATALARWTKAGFKTATDDQYEARKSICLACQFWDGDGYVGMGKCTKCGCSGVKLRFATSECPEKKWGKLV